MILASRLTYSFVITSVRSQILCFLHLSRLRQCLDQEFASLAPRLAFEYNIERIIHDFILFAVFIGNDYLPHLPGLHTRRDGLELLIDVYKRALLRVGGYINDAGDINLRRLQVLVDKLSKLERESFRLFRDQLILQSQNLHRSRGKSGNSSVRSGLCSI